MNSTFRSLAIPNYRIWFFAALISNIGTWMGRIAQDWVVLTEVTDQSASALGIVTGLQFLPFLLLMPWSGMIADRFPKRYTLAVTQVVLIATTGVLAALVLSGQVQLWHVYAIALMQGAATAIDNPARQAFASELVPNEYLPNAIALNSTSFNVGRLVGPGIAGVAIAAWGSGVAMLVNSATFIAMLVALALMRPEQLHPVAAAPGQGSFVAGVRYVAGRPDIILVMALVFIFGTFGMNQQITNALMATQVFGLGASEFGILGTVMGIGSLAGALLSARRARPRMLIFLVAMAGFVVATLASAFAPTYTLFAISLVFVGFTALTTLTTANAMVQMRAQPEVRGRVMALYTTIFFGGTPLGAPIFGWLAQVAGARWSLALTALIVGAGLVGAAIWLRHRDVRVRFDRDTRPHLQVTLPRPVGSPAPAGRTMSR
ncbi:MFS transporter [Kribbia dieselivorans]|uniref:MFS transporter n=1 Tax=Kribbia dieselivorans TaxID=331526 RepID=UPI000839A936|nr:MFS transporter [Kribbia dieselivorans]